jgi:Mg2+ and Co2+ transporter CorA
MAGMNGHLITVEDGSAQEPSLANIQRLLGSSTVFWLDVTGLGPDEAESLLGGTFGFHPLAVEDADHFGQCPKLDAYDGFSLLVVFGPTTEGQDSSSRSIASSLGTIYSPCATSPARNSPHSPSDGARARTVEEAS